VFRQSAVTAASELVDTRAVIAEFSSPDPQADQQRPIGAAGGGGGGRGGGGAGAGRGGAARGSTVSGLPQTAITVTLDGVAVTSMRWRILASGAVERSINNARTWEPIAITPPARITTGTAPSVQVCWLAGREGVVLRTIDGIKFERVTSPDPADFVSVQAVDDQQAAVRTSDGRIFSTRDGGKTWRTGGLD
jgi:hypothetical protein